MRASRDCGTAIVPAADEVLQQAAASAPEVVNGFRIFGNKGLVGTVFQRNILLIEAEEKGATSLGGLVRALENEARAAGATRLDITGYGVINQGFLNPAIAGRFGFTFRQINEGTIELLKEL